jgi:hypothetical protein
MPLLDHFRPPLSEQRHWHSFHNSWATYLSARLNTLLPEGFFAEANVQFGVEIDVAAFDEQQALSALPGWSPPPPHWTTPIEYSDAVVEIGVFSRSGGPVLAGAVELVSPSNKDRPAHREALVSKCASYLHAGVGLVLVDVVTERTADLHRELLLRLGANDPGVSPAIFGSAYRPIERDGVTELDIWQIGVSLGYHCRRFHFGSAAGCVCQSSLKRLISAPAPSKGSRLQPNARIALPTV